ncbi:MAG: exonuclease domain-containing protein [Kiritimatiellia bacterium]
MPVPFPFAAIDFETTGSVAGYPVEPWQVGVVVFRPGEPPDCWESLLRVGERPFHPRAPGRHAKLRDQLLDAPGLEECLPAFRQRCGGLPLLAHNCATEINCLRAALPMERFGPWIDSLKLSRAAWPTLSSHKLEDLLAQFQLTSALEEALPGRGAHDALYDAYGSALILEFLLRQPGWEDCSLDLLLHPDLQAYYRRD